MNDKFDSIKEDVDNLKEAASRARSRSPQRKSYIEVSTPGRNRDWTVESRLRTSSIDMFELKQSREL